MPQQILTFQMVMSTLTENDLIVDIDNLDKAVIEKMITIFNIKTQTVWTDRGAHLYFKKPVGFRGATKVCPLGFEAEYKHIKNTKSITIKRNGTMRKIENESVREDIPNCLFNKSKFDSLLGLDEGEGRNQALFKHRLKLSNMNGWLSIMRFINEHILAQPLDEKEFQTVTRDNVKIEAGKDGEPAVADAIMNKYKVVQFDNRLYYRDDNQFIHDMNRLKRTIFEECGQQKTRYIDEVIKQLEYRSPLIDDSKVFDIKLENGILRDGEFIEVDYQEFTPFNIDINYHSDAEAVSVVDDYVNLLTNHDPNYRNLLFEILAHTLIVNPEFKRVLAKFFIFVGDGGNGKGTLLTIIRKILDTKNVTGLSIQDMTDERYFVTMKGKLANLGDDIQDAPINNQMMKLLKNISTCDFVATRELFKQSQNVEMTLSLIFTSNHILKSFEKGESYKRRVLWLPMYSKPTKKDKNFISKLTTKPALEYWLKLILEGYFRLYETEKFTEAITVNKFNSDYHDENNGVNMFLSDFDKEHFIGVKPPEIYEEYEIWATENGMTVHSRKLLNQSIADKFGLVIISQRKLGRVQRVYTEEKVE